jgi:hypothetical protein
VAVPLESLELPAGWVWGSLSYGSLVGLPGWMGGLRPSDADTYGNIGLSLACSPVAAEVIQRNVQIHTELLGNDRVGVVVIGDGAAALRGEDGDEVTLMWSHGEITGMVRGSSEDFGALEDLAVAVDALLE